MTADSVDWDFGVKFPETKKTRSRSSKSETPTTPKKLPPVPPGKKAERLEKEVSKFGRTYTLYSYDCPSDTCEFNTTWSLNSDAAYKTLGSHLQWEHMGNQK